MQDYQATLKGVARRLRSSHGLGRDESIIWAATLRAADTRCACCGIPNWMLWALKERGPWPYYLGDRSKTSRLELGHIIPARNEGGFVPMCHACNVQLGARVFNKETGASVLKWIRKKWLDIKWGQAEKKVWWLNTGVDERGHGVGGRCHRNPDFEAKRQARYAALRRAS